MLGGALANGINAAIEEMPFAQTENFASETGVGVSPRRAALVSFLSVLIVLALILLLGKFLWNNVLCQLVTVVKPAKSVWQILGLAVLISLMHPGSCNCM